MELFYQGNPIKYVVFGRGDLKMPPPPPFQLVLIAPNNIFHFFLQYNMYCDALFCTSPYKVSQFLFFFYLFRTSTPAPKYFNGISLSHMILIALTPMKILDLINIGKAWFTHALPITCWNFILPLWLGLPCAISFACSWSLRSLIQ